MPAFAFSECAVECAAVDQQVLPGDVTGMGRAKECACRTEFVRVAEAPGWNRRHSVSGNLADAFSFLFGGLGQRAAQPIRIKGAGQYVVDGHVFIGHRTRDACKECGQAGTRTRLQV